MKTILLTGGTGFLGKHLLCRLIDEGYFVLLLVREESDISGILKNKECIKTILFSELENIFSSIKIHGVIHCATLYKKNHGMEDIEEMIFANVTLPTILLDLCVQNGVRNFINTGTFFEYTLGVDTFSEETENHPYNLYATTKLAFLESIKYFVDKYSISIITLRLFSPYGPGENKKIIPLVIGALISGDSLNLQDISQELHFTFISDIIDAFILSLNYVGDTQESFHKVINIGTEKSFSIAEVIYMLEYISGKKLLYSLQLPFAKRNKTYCDCRRAKEIIGWSEKTSLEAGLRITFNTFQNEFR